MVMKTWYLKKKLDRRFRLGHPWVYSNELESSPKGIELGEVVELRSADYAFLARGFGNPHSLISFRSLTRDPDNTEPLSLTRIENLIQKAAQMRMRLGFGQVSHRLFFGEADGIPGLVIDRYRVALKDQPFSSSPDVFVIQAHTSGADRLVSLLVPVLKTLSDQATVILRNDLPVRKREGLTEASGAEILTQFSQDFSEDSLRSIPIWIGSGLSTPLKLFVDLIQGQKTGFFLDQQINVQSVASYLKQLMASRRDIPVRILDLCCYVGQWGTRLAHTLVSAGVKVEVVALDASKQALDFAKRNIESVGASCDSLHGNITQDLPSLSDQSFDCIISDPPSLIPSRKSLFTGIHAYEQLATHVLRMTRPSGMVVMCSCSSLLSEETFVQILSKASQKTSRQGRSRSLHWIHRGTQSPDHPVLAEFPEGNYLKAWVGLVEVPTP